MHKNLEIEEIKALFNESYSTKEIIEKLGLKECGGNRKYVQKLANKINLDYREWVNTKSRCTEEYYNEHPKYCKECGKVIDFKNRRNDYCSHSCAAKHNNLGRKLTQETKQKISNSLQEKNENFNGEYKHIEENLKCLNCGIEITRGKYCSQKCQHEFTNKAKLHKWLSGENFSCVNGRVPSFIKRYLMEKFNNKCQLCGWGIENPKTDTIPLEIHHIDGDCTNNHLDNLQLLCPNCHSLTENFGALNKNSKRFHRSKRKKDD